jgi:predicted acylesterase/phospholipase RssA
MQDLSPLRLLGIGVIALLAGCATRPVNPPITHVDPGAGYRYEARQSHAKREGNGTETLVILAFSGGGTRAAAFSYGVLEFLHDTRVSNSQGQTVRLLDAVDLITGVSGGSCTALAYGLYGEKLFDDYETRFLRPFNGLALTYDIDVLAAIPFEHIAYPRFHELQWPKILTLKARRRALQAGRSKRRGS